MTAAIPEDIRKIAEKHMAENVSPMFPEYHAFEGVVASAILDERERCAQIAEGSWLTLAIADTASAQEQISVCREEIARAIRNQPPTGE